MGVWWSQYYYFGAENTGYTDMAVDIAAVVGKGKALGNEVGSEPNRMVGLLYNLSNTGRSEQTNDRNSTFFAW